MTIIERYRERRKSYPVGYFRKDIFTNKEMNALQAQRLNTDQAVLKFIELTLLQEGEFEMLGGLYEVHEYWKSQDAGPVVPRLLFNFYLSQESTQGRNLDLQEIQAGLGFRPVVDLWRAFLAIATNPESYPTLDDDRYRHTLQQSRPMLASLLRRTSRFEEAREVLEEALRQNSADESLGRPSAINAGYTNYEIGYLAFLGGEYTEAIERFQTSSTIDFDRSDHVGGAISACVEFRMRYLTGACTDREFSSVLSRMTSVFARNSEPPIPKYLHARRWVWNCWVHQLEVAYDSGNRELAEQAIVEIRNRQYLQPDESFMTFYEGIFNLITGRFTTALEYLNKAWAMRAPSDDPMRFTAPESQSQFPYYIGQAHAGAGDGEQAFLYLKKGAELPERPGNHIWQARAKSALRILALGRY